MKKHLLLILALLVSTSLLFSVNIGSEGFEGGTFPPAGWTQHAVTGTDVWASSTSQVHGGSNSAFYNDFSGAHESWLIWGVDISAATDATLTFWDYTKFPTYGDVEDVMWATDYAGSGDPSGATWTTLQTNVFVATWTEHQYAIPDYAGTVYIAFKYGGTYASEWYLDDLSIDFQAAGAPTASTDPVPADLAIDHPVTSNPWVSWTNPTTNLAYNELYLSTDQALVSSSDPLAKVLGNGTNIYTTYHGGANLAWNTTYHWKVVNYNGGYSADSDVFSFSSIRGIAPSTNFVPVNDTTGVALDASPTLSWTNPIERFTHNSVYFSTDEALVTAMDAGVLVLGDGSTAYTQYSAPADLEEDTDYYWRVVNFNTAAPADSLPTDPMSFGTEWTSGVDLSLGTANSSNTPWVFNYGYTWSQMIYDTDYFTGHDLTDKRIESIWWNPTAAWTTNDSIKIYLGTTNEETFATTTSWEPVGSLSEVYNGNFNPTAAGWYEIVLDTPYEYSGSRNLIVAVHEYKAGYHSQSVKGLNTSTNIALLYRSDSTNPDPATPPTGLYNTYLPNARFTIGDIPAGAQFGVNPNSDLGAVDVGDGIDITLTGVDLPTTTFTIMNSGIPGSTIDLASIMIRNQSPATVFTLDQDYSTMTDQLGQNEQLQFTVTFDPIAAVTYTGDIEIEYTSADSRITKTVNITGSGWDPVVRAYPYVVNFDTAPTYKGWGVTGTWEVSSTEYNGPSADHTTGSGSFAVMDDPYTAAATQHALVRTLDLSSLTAPYLKFWYWVENYSTSQSSLHLDVRVAGDSLWTEDLVTMDLEDAWSPVIFDATAYISTATEFRFRAIESTTSSSDVAIDDFSVVEQVDPIYASTPSILTFGDVIANTSSNGTEVTISNMGEGVVQLNSLSFTGTNGTDFAHSNYTLDGSASVAPSIFSVISIASGSTYAFDVVASPAALGGRIGVLDIEWCDQADVGTIFHDTKNMSVNGIINPATNLVAVSGVDTGSPIVDLTWDEPILTASRATIDSFLVYKGIASATYTDSAYVTVRSWRDTNVIADSTYYYAVKTIYAEGESALSNEATATPTLERPAAVTYSYPADAATSQTVLRTLSWQASTLANGYYVYCASDSAAVVASTATSNDVMALTFDPTDELLSGNLKYGTKYFWKVVPYNAVGITSDPVVVWSFSTADGIPSLSTPSDEAVDQAINVVLNWGDVANSDGYKVSVGTSTGGSDVVDQAVVTASEYVHSAPWEYSQIYYWTVWTVQDNNASRVIVDIESEERSFTTREDPAQTTPFLQDFTNATFPPVDWAILSGEINQTGNSTVVASSGTWIRDEWSNVASHDNGFSAQMNIYGTTRKHWLVTPPVIVPDDGLEYYVDFDVANNDWTSSTVAAPEAPGVDEPGVDDKFAVVVSTDEGLTWSHTNILQIWTDETTPSLSDFDSLGTHVQLPLTGYTGRLMFAFYGESLISNADWDFSLDNLEVRTPAVGAEFHASTTEQTYTTIAMGAETDSVAFIIDNSGIDSLRVDEIVMSANGTDWTISYPAGVSTLPWAIPADAEQTVYARFSPQTAGAKDATMQFKYMSAVVGEISLIGEAYDPVVASYPYECDFETEASYLGWNFQNNWEVSDYDYSGPSDDHTLAPATTGHFALMNDPYTTVGDHNLVTRPLNLTSLTAPYVKFWYWTKYYSSAQTTIYLDAKMATDTLWTEDILAMDITMSSNSNPWEYTLLNVTDYISSATEFRFRAVEDGGTSTSSSNTAIDDFVVMEQVDPIYSSSISSLSFGDISVNSSSGGNEYVITNLGQGVIQLSDISFTGDNLTDFAHADYTLDGSPSNAPSIFSVISISSGSEYKFNIIATPTDLGVRTADVDITWEDQAFLTVYYHDTMSINVNGVLKPATALGGATGVDAGNPIVDLSWTAPVSRADLIRYDVFKGMASATYTDSFEVVAPTTTWRDTAVDADSTYFYAVRAVYTEGLADLTAEVSFTPTLAAPDSCNYSYPADAATSQSVSRTLTWVASELANGYYVYCASDSAAVVAGTATSNDISATTFDPTDELLSGNLKYGTTYFWKVVPYNAVGITEGEVHVWSFTTATGIASGASPSHEATAVANDAILNWYNVANSAGYKLDVGTTVGGTDVLNHVVVTESEYTPSALWDYGVTYYWTVWTVQDNNAPTRGFRNSSSMMKKSDMNEVESRVIVDIQGSEWNFTVRTDPAVVTPFIQDFSATTFPPADWSIVSGEINQTGNSTVVASSGTWIRDEWSNVSSHVNGYAAQMNIYSTSRKHWLVTPPVIVPDDGLDYFVDFDIANNEYAGGTVTAPVAPGTGEPGDDDKFAVVVSTDEGLTWSHTNILQIWTNETTPALSDVAYTGTHVQLPLTGYTGRLMFAFYGESLISNADWDFSLDNIVVRTPAVAPEFHASLTEKDYGEILEGTSTAPTAFVISNSGAGVLEIDEIVMSDNASDWNISYTASRSALPWSLAAGVSDTVYVAFTPNNAGVLDANLQFNYQSTLIDTISLIGSAILADNNEVHTDATAITLGSTATYTINVVDDRDWYKVYINDGFTVKFETSATAGEDNYDTQLWLYGPLNEDGTVIGTNVAFNPTQLNELGEDDDDGDANFSLLSQLIPDDGWYFFQVAHYTDDPPSSRDLASYDLSVDITAYPTPVAPTDVAIAMGADVTITWTTTSWHTGYRVESSTDMATWTEVTTGSLDITGSAATFTVATPGVATYYHVISIGPDARASSVFDSNNNEIKASAKQQLMKK